MDDCALITGAGGQDGSLLAERLATAGQTVLAVLRPGGSRPAVAPPAASTAGRIEWLELDLRDAQALGALVERCRPTAVYHLAAAHHASQEAHSRQALQDRQAMIDLNFGVVRTLAFALLEHGLAAHLVVAGSSQMYRPRADGQDLRVDELTPFDPSTFYGQTKVWAADLLRTLRREHGLRASLAVLFNHESPRRRPAFLSRKVSLAAARAAAGVGQPIELLNLGARTDWSAASDIVDALQRVAARHTGGEWVLGSGQAHSVRELVEAAFLHAGLDWREWITARRDERGAALVACTDRAERELGWQRRLGFDALVASLVDADREALAREPR